MPQSQKQSMNEIKDILRQDERLVSEDDKLLKNKVAELARKLDEDLITLLLKNKATKERFFKDIGDTTIFDVDAFTSFVHNKDFLPDSYTSFKNKIGLTNDRGDFISRSNEVVLSWPYKDCVLEGGQTKEDAKRDEIFWNETLAPDEIRRLFEPKALTDWQRIDKDGEHEVEELKEDDKGNLEENLVLQGNNLLALHSLKERFAGKVKLIYIDPPYNTDRDNFSYNDSFNHSTWLTFMRNRLDVADKLLSDDGFIFIQIDDIEQSYLKNLCDEVFQRKSFQTNICVQMSYLSGVKMAHKDKKIPKIKEYILMYSKSDNPQITPQYSPASWDDALDRYTSFINKKGFNEKDCEKWEIITLNQAIKRADIDSNNESQVNQFKLDNADKIFRTARNRGADYSNLPSDKFSKVTNLDDSYYFVYKGEDVVFAADKVQTIRGKKTPVEALGDIWTDIGINNLANEGGVDLRFGKKPEKLLKRIIDLATDEGDIVMDFFAGSGTTGAVAHKMSRKYIMVEQLSSHIKKMRSRLKNVIEGEESGVSSDVQWEGGGDVVFAELAKSNQEYREQIKSAKVSELKKIWKEIQENGFLSWQVDLEKINEEAESFNDLLKEDMQKFLLDVLDNNHLYVNYGDIADKRYEISEDDKDLNKEFYGNI
ncbi:MAG: site-specific DNA-methyltransferase [Candidatus Paceibacterota bacterium]